jgi:hypothetical protein
MKRPEVIAASLCLVVVLAVLTSWYVRRTYTVQPLPSVPEESSEPTPRQTYIKLSPFDVQRLLSGNCTTINTAGELPETIKSAFATITRDKPFSLADPGSRFNATDVIEPGLPRRRLVLAGRCENRWFIEYEHGGIGMSTALMVLRVNSDRSVSLVWGRALRGGAKNIKELRAALSGAAYYDEPYYW